MEQIFILKEPIGTVKNVKSIFENIKKINIDYSQENFLIFYLNSKNKISKSEILFKGAMDSCTIDFKVIFRNALKYKAISIIIAHNHPSGDLTPSDNDKDIFSKIIEAGKIIQIKILDSIIFSKKEFYSMEEI
jgi:DNA repair protein RadC